MELLPSPFLTVLKNEDGNVLFYDPINTFHSRLYGVGHIVKDNSAREKTPGRHFIGYSFD